MADEKKPGYYEEEETPAPRARKHISSPRIQDDMLAEKLDEFNTLLTRTATKLDGTNQRLDDFTDRMDRADKQRELDRAETNSIQVQLAGVAATCRLHIDRTTAAENFAVDAAKVAATAREKATAVEQSWNDMRLHMQSRPSSGEHQKINAALAERQKTKEAESAELEIRVAAAASAAVTHAMAVRDEAKRQVQKEQDEQFERDEKKRKIRRAAIQWGVGLIVSTVVTLGGSSLWRQARINQEQTAKALETARALHAKEVTGGAAPPVTSDASVIITPLAPTK